MTPAHLHLILNHFTVVGSVFGFALLAWAMLRKSREAVMLSLICNVVIALISIPVYFTGEPASDQVAHLDGVAPDAIEEHEEAANFAFAAVECVGALALAGLLLFRTEPVPRWFLTITLVGALLSVGAVIYTADRGRRIRHTELGWLAPARLISVSVRRRSLGEYRCDLWPPPLSFGEPRRSSKSEVGRDLAEVLT